MDRGTSYHSVWMDLVTTEFCQGYVECGGLRTRYAEAGPESAPPVVLLHGTGGHWETFSRTIPALSESFHCYAPDMLGCGFTDRVDRPYEIKDYVGHALAFMDAKGIARASFIGVSLGSWVASRLAVDAPDRIDRLILNSPAGLLPLSAEATRSVGTRQESSIDPSWDKVKGTLAHLFYDPDQLNDDLVAVRQRVYNRPDPDGLVGRMLTLFDPEVRRRNLLTPGEWASIAAPTMVVAHVDAPDDYLETARRIVTMIPDATTVEIRHASHWPHFEQADAFNEAASKFLVGGLVP